MYFVQALNGKLLLKLLGPQLPFQRGRSHVMRHFLSLKPVPFGALDARFCFFLCVFGVCFHYSYICMNFGVNHCYCWCIDMPCIQCLFFCVLSGLNDFVIGISLQRSRMLAKDPFHPQQTARVLALRNTLLFSEDPKRWERMTDQSDLEDIRNPSKNLKKQLCSMPDMDTQSSC